MLCGALDWTRGHLLQGTNAVGEGPTPLASPSGQSRASGVESSLAAGPHVA